VVAPGGNLCNLATVVETHVTVNLVVNPDVVRAGTCYVGAHKEASPDASPGEMASPGLIQVVFSSPGVRQINVILSPGVVVDKCLCQDAVLPWSERSSGENPPPQHQCVW